MDKIKKPITIGYTILMILSVILTVWYYFTMGQGNQEKMMDATNIFLKYTYFLFALAIISALGFSFVSIFANAKNAKRGFIGLGIIGGLFVLAFALSSNEIPQFLGSEKFFSYPDTQKAVYDEAISQGATVQDAEIAAQEEVTAKGQSFARYVDSSLKFIYIIFLCAIGAMLFTGIRSAFS